MRTTLFGLGAAWLILAQTCHGGLVVGLSSTAPDLSHLTVGQVVQFDVLLSGLGDVGNPADLSYLGVDIAFSALLLGTPTSVDAGAIVPSPADTFTPGSGAGIATGVFDNIFLPFPGPVITGNGVFMSFSVTVKSTGSGTVAFDPSASGFDGSNNPVDIDSSGVLSFTVDSTAVPEPSSLALAGLACLGAIVSRVSAAARKRFDRRKK